jgi:hypothetical protein
LAASRERVGRLFVADMICDLEYNYVLSEDGLSVAMMPGLKVEFRIGWETDEMVYSLDEF